MKTTELRPEYVQFIPDDPIEGVLYVSKVYQTTVHLCPCGCENEVVVPIGGIYDWMLLGDRDSVTIVPSIGNWQLDCKSHYFIRNNEVIWC